MHVYVIQTSFTTKPRFEIVKLQFLYNWIFLRQCSKSWKEHPRKEGKYVKNLICLQMRLGVEMCSSGVIMYKGHLCQKDIFTYYSF